MFLYLARRRWCVVDLVAAIAIAVAVAVAVAIAMAVAIAVAAVGRGVEIFQFELLNVRIDRIWHRLGRIVIEFCNKSTI